MEGSILKHSWWGVALGAVSGLLGAGLLLLVSRNPAAKPLQLLPPPTPAPSKVYITGAVMHPRVYDVSPDARLEDALKLAGGPAPEADLSLINLAAQIEDGQKIWIATIPPLRSPDAFLNDGEEDISPEGTYKRININSATQAQLETLPHIGPGLAREIIRYREEHGPFRNATDIQDVPGIGPAIFARIKDLITVGDQPME